METTNGVTKQYIGSTYQLQPKAKGNFTIAAATATADGKTLKSFSDGGIICSTCRAFSIISLSSAVSFLPIVDGEMVAVRRAWANKAAGLIIGNKKISSKNFFSERLIITGDTKVNYSKAIIV